MIKWFDAGGGSSDRQGSKGGQEGRFKVGSVLSFNGDTRDVDVGTLY